MNPCGRNFTISNAITFRAWDQASGTAGGNANTTSNGGTSAFSVATDTAGITSRLLADPRLIRLPLVRHGEAYTAGRAEPTWKAWLARPK